MSGRKVWVQDPETLKLILQEAPALNVCAAPIIIEDIGDFQNPRGMWLNGRKALRNDLARQNCHVYELGERQHIDNMRVREEREDRRALHGRIAEIAIERGLGRPD